MESRDQENFRDDGSPNESDHAASSWEENSVPSARLGGDASLDDIPANGGRGVAPSVLDADGVPFHRASHLRAGPSYAATSRRGNETAFQVKSCQNIHLQTLEWAIIFPSKKIAQSSYSTIRLILRPFGLIHNYMHHYG